MLRIAETVSRILSFQFFAGLFHFPGQVTLRLVPAAKTDDETVEKQI